MIKTAPKAAFRSLKRFGFFRLFVMVMLTYIAVMLVFYTELPPYGAIRDASHQQPTEDASYWIDQLRVDNGIFLHVRHADRKESTDIKGFDFWEKRTDKPSESIEDFICLTEEGKAQAEFLGWVFEELKVPLFSVASPSCRARETARLSTSEIHQIDVAHLYSGALPQGLKASLDSRRKDFFRSFPVSERGTTVIFGHESLAYSDSNWVVRKDGEIMRKQGGVSIMSWDSSLEELTVHYTFETASDFAFAVFTKASDGGS